MDAANYWSSIQQAGAASNRAAANVHPVHANVVELNSQSAGGSLMPYSGVEVIPAASLELLMNQQRLAGVSGWRRLYR